MNALKTTAAVIGALLCFALITATTTATPTPTDYNAAVMRVENANMHGSGVHIGHGLILTANHVITDGGSFTVTDAEGHTVTGTVKAAEPLYDVALIQTNYKGPAADLNCDPAKVGDHIRIAGNPHEIEFINTWGRIAGKARKASPWAEVLIGDAAAWRGNSGGPVFDTRDRVVGVLVGGWALPVSTPADKNGKHGQAVVDMDRPNFIVPATVVCRLWVRNTKGN